MFSFMITFKCPNCNYSFSEADKAWDTAVENGCCPRCKKVNPMFSFDGTLKPKTSAEPLDSQYFHTKKIVKVCIFLLILFVILLCLSDSSGHTNLNPLFKFIRVLLKAL